MTGEWTGLGVEAGLPSTGVRRGEPGFETALARVLDRRLDQLDVCLEIQSRRETTWESSLWFVPSEADAKALEAEGVSRGRIWTAAELGRIRGATPADLRRIIRVKASVAGTVEA